MRNKLTFLFIGLFGFLFMPLGLSSCKIQATTSYIPPEPIPYLQILNKDPLTLVPGESCPLEIESALIEEKITYESSNPSLVFVDENGYLHAKKVGNAKIKAFTSNLEDTLDVIVCPTKEEPCLFFESPSCSLRVGEEVIVSFKTNASDYELTISDSRICDVKESTSSSLTLFGKKEGNTVITLSFLSKDEGRITAKLNVEVLSRITSFSIGEDQEVQAGSFVNFVSSVDPSIPLEKVHFLILEGEELGSFEGSDLYVSSPGIMKVRAEYDGIFSNTITIRIYSFKIEMKEQTIVLGDYEKIDIRNYQGNINHLYSSVESSLFTLVLNGMGDLFFQSEALGEVEFYLYDMYGEMSNSLKIKIIEEVKENPYISIKKEEFYSSYEPAFSYQDARYRSECYLMSGTLEVPSQEPEISANRPVKDGKYIHNTVMNYSEQGKAYTVMDENGDNAFTVYYGAAYTSLEEVSAYIYAWGDVPINYSISKSANPFSSPWGEYLRLNHSEFYGDVESYPYEPELPHIAGCGGNLLYYEVDIGTTGTDCDPNYPNKIYNDGYEISRGAARIVYSRYYLDTGEEVRPEDRYVFYTYNHYNDFQEYLNYENGWGEMFGNITGGGVISSKNPSLCHPTPYVESVRAPLS